MKKTEFMFIALLLCVVLTIVAFAHSGRTDSNGGHYDRSSGEYHYHHGYSAHDHYDMDGDGDKDCPYKFKDKTNSKDKSETTTSKKEEEDKSFPVWGWFVVAAVITCVSGAVIQHVREK